MYLLRWLLNSVIKLHLLFCFVFYLCNFIWVNICLIILQTMWTTLSYDVTELRWWEGLIFIRFKTSIFIVLVSGWKIEDMIVCASRNLQETCKVWCTQETHDQSRVRSLSKSVCETSSAVPTMAKYMVEGEIKKAN